VLNKFGSVVLSWICYSNENDCTNFRTFDHGLRVSFRLGGEASQRPAVDREGGIIRTTANEENYRNDRRINVDY